MKYNLRPFDFFDKKFVINLASEKNRLNRFRKETKGLTVSRFNAITHNSGMVGCGHSHKEIIRIGLNTNCNSILIFEDDAEFINYDPLILEKAINSLKNWDVFRISYTFRGSMEGKERVDLKKIGDCTFTNKDARDGTFFPNFSCVAYHKRSFTRILNEFDPDTHPIIDRYIPANYYNIYLNPYMCIQSGHKKEGHIELDNLFKKTYELPSVQEKPKTEDKIDE